jgi:hypothetical protein
MEPASASMIAPRWLLFVVPSPRENLRRRRIPPFSSSSLYLLAEPWVSVIGLAK